MDKGDINLNFFKNPVSEIVWSDRYKKGTETLEQNFERVAKHCSNSKEQYDRFLSVLKDGLFYPAGRTMSNSGIGSALSLVNCHTSPMIEDSLDSIFSAVTLGAKTHQRGGGIGFSFSQIRPSGTPTSNDAIASGPLSFMRVFDAQTACILQGGRRGANMGVLSVYHMDIKDYITAKSKNKDDLKHFNISVIVDDDFMKKVENEEDYYVHHPVYDADGKVITDPSKWKYSEKRSAKEVWDLVVEQAYLYGEPGVLFETTMNNDNNLWYIESINATNPCKTNIYVLCTACE